MRLTFIVQVLEKLCSRTLNFASIAYYDRD